MTDKGFTDQVKGKAKEVAGKVTDDKKMEADGLLDQAIGKAKEVANDVKDTTDELIDKAKDKFKDKE